MPFYYIVLSRHVIIFYLMYLRFYFLKFENLYI